MNDNPISQLHDNKIPPFIIAEMSCNHNGSLQNALEIITQAKLAGASAIKLQTYRADTITIKSSRPEFQIHHPLWQGQNLYDLYAKAFTPWEWHRELFAWAKQHGIVIFSAPFDFSAVDLLESCECPIYKIASPEAIDLPLIRRVAQCQKPMIISTGMTDFQEIYDAVNTATKYGCPEIALLHCMSSYPCPLSEMNLSMIEKLASEFGKIIGLSDHSMGFEAPMMAVALGARIIEKHFTLSRQDGGFDAEFSSEPHELQAMIIRCKQAHEARGNGEFRASGEVLTKPYRRSLYIVKNIAKGEKFSQENIRSIRPNNGLAPKYSDDIMGKFAKRDCVAGTPLCWDDIEI